MTDIKDKIAKLLALAGNNSSENEAQAALLRARKLMAEYKLRPEECQKTETAKVVQSLSGISVTARKYSWAANLSAVIAEHYCCIAYRCHVKGKQMQDIGFVGLEDDFEVCVRIFRYAFDCVKQTSDEIFAENASYYPADIRRKNAEAYGYAFCNGLQEAFDAQKEEHQEWGLVMMVPQAVKDTEIGKTKPKPYGSARRAFDGSSLEARVRGHEDGRKFDPATRLAQANSPLTIEGAKLTRKWCAEIVQDCDGRYYANLTINGELVKGLPEYVDYGTLREAISAKTGIVIPLQNHLPRQYWVKIGRKKYAYIDATRQREDCRVTLEEINNGWKPDFSF